MKYLTLIITVLLSAQITTVKVYQRDYYDKGTVASEGWTINDKKINYWKNYHINGTIKSEGHYSKN